MPDPINQLKAALADRYGIEREIARGGMAFVYLAEDLKLGRKVALKLLHPGLRHVVEGERFLEEIRVTAKLNHPSILPLFDSGEADGLLYYVMPYVYGETLTQRLEREGRLPVSDAIFIAAEIANALDFAHREGVVHRDVKPGNILLQAGKPLIGDFGIALGLATDPDQRVTAQGLMVGTPEYMSPEQAHADPNLDGRSDIYSLGAVLYEMLVGEPPFVGKNVHAVLTKVIKEKPTPVRTRRESVPNGVDAAVLRALARDPAERFNSAAEFADALTTSSRATRPLFAPVEENVVPRKRRTAAVVTALLVVLAVVAGFTVAIGRGPQILTAGQTHRFTNDLGLELDPAISPDGGSVAYASGPLGAMKIYLRESAESGASIGLTETIAGHHRSPRWSPEGTEIAFLNTAANGSAVQVVPTTGGPARTVVQTEGGEDEIFGVSWSPDGTRMAYGRRGGIYTVSAAGGEPRRLVELVDGHSPSWSPDGSRIVFVSGNPTFVYGTFVLGNIAPSALWTVSVRDGRSVRLTETTYLHMSPVWTSDGKSLVFVSNHDGRRDIYQVPVGSDGKASGERVRLTTGLNVHTVSLAGDASFLTYSVLQMNANIWSLDIPERGRATTAAAVPVTDGNQTIEGMAVSPDGDWLAYDSDQNGTQDIYRLRLDGGEPERLTTDPRDDFYPAWTRDGTELAFYSFRSGKRDVWMMDADGSNETQVTSDEGHNRAPQWSPDGRSIVYHSDKTGRAELYVVSRSQDTGEWSEPRRLTQDGGFDPHWSPDGQHIAYIESETVRLISVDGGEPRILMERSSDPDTPVPWALAWSPDGGFIYYKALDEMRRSSFWSIPVAGGTPRLLTEFDDPTFQSRRNEFDTDGRRFFFTVGNHESDIWMMDLRDSGEAQEIPEF
jgi:serine/threonine-protein kinase